MKNPEFDHNGHMISYTNDQGTRITDHDYLAKKQAKAIAKELAKGQEPEKDMTPNPKAIAIGLLLAPIAFVAILGFASLIYFILSIFFGGK